MEGSSNSGRAMLEVALSAAEKSFSQRDRTVDFLAQADQKVTRFQSQVSHIESLLGSAAANSSIGGSTRQLLREQSSRSAQFDLEASGNALQDVGKLIATGGSGVSREEAAVLARAAQAITSPKKPEGGLQLFESLLSAPTLHAV